MKLGAKIFGGLATLLLLYLLVGALLPGTWRAREATVLPAPPATIFPFLNSLEAWQAWTPFPEASLESYGPPEGLGAGIRWDDPQYGRGEAEITGSVGGRSVTYRVDVENGSLIINGTMTLRGQADGTLIEWIEEGDFGWNPLMGYAAKGMASSQGEAMKASLERLKAAVAGGA